MKKFLASIAALTMALTMSVTAFAATYTSSKTIAEGVTFTDSDTNIMNFGTSLTFTNNGTCNISNSFSLYKVDFINNGEFTFVGDSFSVGTTDDGSTFTNNGTLEINSAGIENSTFSVESGTTFNNTGVLYLYNIKNYNLDGTLTNTGYIVYDENVNVNMVNALKAKVSNVLSVAEYEALNGAVTALPGSKDSDVKAKYVAGEESDIVYSVDVEWGAMEFTYTAASEGTWDPDTHTYKDIVDAKWTENGNTVKVTNHSNAPVDVDFSYSKATGFEDLTGLLSVTSDTLDAGVENDYDNADSVTSALTLSGDLASTATTLTKVGTVTVTLTE